MIKRILFIALKYSYGREELGEALNKRALLNNFNDLGYTVETIWLDEYSKDELQKIIIKKSNDFKPDIIFFKIFRDEILIETLERLKQRFYTVNWFGDDQWRFDKFTSKYALYFDACITTDKFSVSKYIKIGQKNIIRSQHASFENNNEYKNINYLYDVSFVGGANTYRKWFVKQLKMKDIHVECFGKGWPNGRISYDEMDEIMLKTKINLNISNSLSFDVRYLLFSPVSVMLMIKSYLSGGEKNCSQTKARIFEIPVKGGFELTEYVPSLEDYYDIGKNIACYNSVDEASVLIKYYLENHQEREAIKYKSVDSSRNNHTYMNRVKEFMVELVKLHINKNETK